MLTADTDICAETESNVWYSHELVLEAAQACTFPETISLTLS